MATLDEDFLNHNHAIDISWVTDASGKVTSSLDFTKQPDPGPAAQGNSGAVTVSVAPESIQTIRSGAQVWKINGELYLAGSAPLKDGTLYVARHLPSDFSERYAAIESQTDIYHQQKQQLRAYKREILLWLMLITLLLLFTTTWVALFLSKQVTVPIQALAEATREISRGNFDHQIDVQAQDELGTLVRSFNRMTEQLGEGRRQINEFTQSLEQAIEERERRRKLMEAILENIPTGVVSLDASGEIARVNSAVVTILGDRARRAHSLDGSGRRRGGARRAAPDAAVAADGRGFARNRNRDRRAAGAHGGDGELAGPRRSNPGFVVVIDDLTDLSAGAKSGRVAGSGAADRARDQEPADADPAFGAAPAALSGPLGGGEPGGTAHGIRKTGRRSARD